MTNFQRRKRGRKKERSRPKYYVYSDGSADNQSVSGAGYVALIYKGDTFVCYCAGSKPTDEDVTNSQAELMAVQLAIYELIYLHK